VAELVDALDSGSSGLTPVGVQVPPFAPSFLVLVLLLAALLSAAGCKTTEQKLLEESLALNEEVFQLLNDNIAEPGTAIRKLTELEETSRDARRQLREDFKAAFEKLDDKAKKTFEEEGRARYEEYATKFQTVVKRYPPEKQQRLRQLIGIVTH
jgi:hypothetical protein